MSFVIKPLPFINISISMNKFTTAISFVTLPISFVSRSIWPNLITIAISHIIKPLSCICSTIFQSNRASLNVTSIIFLLLTFKLDVSIIYIIFKFGLAIVALILTILFIFSNWSIIIVLLTLTLIIHPISSKSISTSIISIFI